jgi:hypothetical protein
MTRQNCRIIEAAPCGLFLTMPPMPKPPSSRHAQYGYLLEVPILIVAALLVLSVLFPALPPMGRKILLVVVASAITLGLYYMIVIPGWMPGDKARLRPPWNLLVFAVVAGAIAAVTVAILFGMKS